MDPRILALLGARGTKQGGALFDALNDMERSAVTQTTGGNLQKMRGIENVMQGLQRRMTPEDYQRMMEERMMINESPIAQILEQLKVRK